MMRECWKSGRLSSQDKECVEYFRRKSVFDRILQGFRDKYMSYGSFSGTVIVRNLSAEEREDRHKAVYHRYAEVLERVRG